MVKIYHIRYADEMQWSFRSIQNFFEIHSKTKSPERVEYFSKFALVIEILFKVMTIVYTLTVFMFFPYPIYTYFYKNEVVPILPVILPFIDYSTPVGYIFLSVFQTLTSLFCTLGYLAFDYFVTVITLSSLIFAKLISLEIEQMCAELELKKSEMTTIGRFRNVLLMHKEMLE